jgi:4-carboxymuconolactone decarboxylase
LTDEVRQRGLDMMKQVYGWDLPADVPGDFFAVTIDHLFAEIWARPALTIRERRLLLIGAVAAQGNMDIAKIQLTAALHNEEFDADQLREIALFLTHYVGWPSGTKLDQTVSAVLAEAKKKRAANE